MSAAVLVIVLAAAALLAAVLRASRFESLRPRWRERQQRRGGNAQP